MTLIHLPDPTNDDLPICLNGGKLMERVFVEAVGGKRANCGACKDCKDGGKKPVLMLLQDVSIDVYEGDPIFEDLIRFERYVMESVRVPKKVVLHG